MMFLHKGPSFSEWVTHKNKRDHPLLSETLYHPTSGHLMRQHLKQSIKQHSLNVSFHGHWHSRTNSNMSLPSHLSSLSVTLQELRRTCEEATSWNNMKDSCNKWTPWQQTSVEGHLDLKELWLTRHPTWSLDLDLSLVFQETQQTVRPKSPVPQTKSLTILIFFLYFRPQVKIHSNYGHFQAKTRKDQSHASVWKVSTTSDLHQIILETYSYS
jgi:hypothetical protein